MNRRKFSIVIVILPVLAVILIIGGMFLCSVREVQILTLSDPEGYTAVRYTDDIELQLDVQVERANFLASQKVVYSSDQPEVAEVSEDGLITMKNPGTAVITAKAKYCPWKKDTFTVQVVQKALGMQIAMPEELPSNEYYYLLHTGDEVSFVPLPDPLNGLVENLSFESSNPDVVTVTEDGAILAHKGGVAAIDVSWVGPYTEDGMTENLGRFWVNVCRKTDHDRLEDHELQWYEESCLVAHALGNAGEYIYTNTRDALEQSIEEGYLTLEVDLSLTSDGEVVCRHTWYSDDFEVSYDGTVPDLETFRKEKYFGTLSTLTGRELLEIWQEHPQLYFMLDVKQDENTNFLEVLTKFKALAEEMGCEELLEHMIVQLYAIEDYDKINEIYPVKHWLFTTYQLPDTPGAEIEAAAFAAEKDFGVLTVPAWCMSSDYFIELADEYGLDLFVHTVNTDSDIQRSSKRGIYGYYSDFLVPSDPAGNGE